MDTGPQTEDLAPGTSLRRRARLLRLALVLLTTIALWVVGRRSGLSTTLTVDQVRATVERAGAMGVLIYMAVFALGQLVHVPGPVFVSVGILAYGKLIGYGISLLAGIFSVSVSFLVVRTVGGRALSGLERPLLRRMLAQLEAQPIRTLIALRTVFWLGSALNYTLALTNIRFRSYVIGSALGLIGPVLLMTLLFDWLLSYLRA